MVAMINRPPRSFGGVDAERLARRALAAALNSEPALKCEPSTQFVPRFARPSEAGLIDAAVAVLLERVGPSPVLDRALELLRQANTSDAACPSR